MAQPPSKIPRLAAAAAADHGGTNFGTRNNKGSGGGAKVGPSPMGLGLSLGGGGGDGVRNIHGGGAGGGGGYWPSHIRGFTLLQKQELEHQSLIYSYIKAGVAVPYPLLLPIWKSVAGSLSGLHRQPTTSHHTSLGTRPLSSDYYKNSVKPEARRCRRTDGKKWRCSRDVLLDNHYCDKHAHRGRHHSKNQLPPPKIATAAVTHTASRVG